jgi:hypothetical protein
VLSDAAAGRLIVVIIATAAAMKATSRARETSENAATPGISTAECLRRPWVSLRVDDRFRQRRTP